MPAPTFHLLTPADAHMLDQVAPGAFDNPIDPEMTARFLADRHHHMVVAREAGVVVAFASAVHYLHPDKQPQMWINEVGTAPSHRRRGLAKELLGRMVAHAREIGCVFVWLATEHDNEPARALYRGMGWEETEHIAMYEVEP